MAMVRTMMPMPPSQWVRLRQSSSPRGWASMSDRMDAPVVVNPDMDSKKASVKESNPPRAKGRAPKQAQAAQPRATMTMPSRWLMARGPGRRKPSMSRAPASTVTHRDSASGVTDLSS